jgi:nitrate reductase NapA
VEINPDDASRMGITNGMKIKVSSRRGSVAMKASINGRGRPPRGMVFVPFFDESYLIKEVTLNAVSAIITNRSVSPTLPKWPTEISV